jgi:hypothetical protein
MVDQLIETASGITFNPPIAKLGVGVAQVTVIGVGVTSWLETEVPPLKRSSKLIF